MNLILALIARYLGQNDKRSRASVLYKEARLHGSASDRLREKLRRAVREILAFYVFATFALFLYGVLHRPQVPEHQVVVPALLLAAIAGPVCWLVYRLIRFAIAR